MAHLIANSAPYKLRILSINIWMLVAGCWILNEGITFSAYGSPLMAFFFNAKASSVDQDGDGGDDYILCSVDVDLDENVTTTVTVIATLYDQTDNVVTKGQISYSVTGQEEDYARFTLIPNPNIEGTYYVHLALSDLSDELYIGGVYYNPQPGRVPIAYFADVVPFSEMNSMGVELDVNIIQQRFSDITVKAELLNSAGDLVTSKTIDYGTYFEDMDYKQLIFTPPAEDVYSVILLVYPKGSEAPSDSCLLEIIWPPGTGAYFSKYEATNSGNSIRLAFDIDLAYNITYPVSVEAILYNPDGDVIGYNYISYLTTGSSQDEQNLLLVPEQTLVDGCYVELIAYIEGYPASLGYITSLGFIFYTITATSGNGGTIRPSGSVAVDHGASQTFTITPSAGYHTTDVKVDGASKGAIDTYTFTNVSSNHTIDANFEETVIKGDVNRDGLVSADDAILTLLITVKATVPTDYQKWAADMNDDGKVRANDAILILRKVVSLPAPDRSIDEIYDGKIAIMFPSAHGRSGEYITIPLTVDKADEVAGGYACISYDSEVLRAIGVSSDSNVLLADNIASGLICIAFASINGIKSKTLANIRFDVIADDVSPLIVEGAELYRSDATPLGLKKVDGQFLSWAKPAERNLLLQNFPNPLNPDTWIPYQLKEDTDVVIRIYTTANQLVREMDLGRKSAGFYITKDRAAYWDGKNESGESVASGIYFYTIQAGDFVATKKMVVAQ